MVTAGSDSSTRTSAAWVTANFAAVTEAIESAHGGALTIHIPCSCTRTLMAGSGTLDQHVGVTRAEQGCIGGTSPLGVALRPVSTCSPA